MIDVLVCDDDRRTREALRAALSVVPGVRRVGVAGSGEEVLARWPRERPDLTLLDLRMPGLGGLGAARVLQDRHPEAAVLLLVDRHDTEGVEAALAADVRGTLLKDMGPADLAAAVAQSTAPVAVPAPRVQDLEPVLVGAAGAPTSTTDTVRGTRPPAAAHRPGSAAAPSTPLHSSAVDGSGPGRAPRAAGGSGSRPAGGRPEVPDAVAVAAGTLEPGPGRAGPGPAALERGGRVAGLTEREVQVLIGMADGKSNAEIGRDLYLSEDTVKTHARRLFRKLEASDRAQAVAVGFRLGLVR